MRASNRRIRKATPRYFSVRRNSYLILLIFLILIAWADHFFLSLSRRTFVFYSALEGATIVEDRMFRGSSYQETDIRRYVEEVILGPVSPDAAPLFPRETRLRSLLYREGVVYADFSEAALLPASSSGSAYLGFLTLNEGIRRNFSSVKDIKLFIGGKEIFLKEFREILPVSADNVTEPVNKY